MQNPTVSYKQGNNARPRTRTRHNQSDLVIPTRLTREAPLAECEVWNCHNVTTVGPLCLTHWELKVAMRDLQKTVHLASNPSPSRRGKHSLSNGTGN